MLFPLNSQGIGYCSTVTDVINEASAILSFDPSSENILAEDEVWSNGRVLKITKTKDIVTGAACHLKLLYVINFITSFCGNFPQYH